MQDYFVKPIAKEDVLSIRSQILRNGIPPSECVFSGDELPTTFHLGGFKGERLICIGSFYLEPTDKLHAKVQYRLRGMATLPEYRGQSAGTLLIREAERMLRERNADLWWCNARISAAPYYEKLGLLTLGGEFMIEGIGPHKMMYRELKIIL